MKEVPTLLEQAKKLRLEAAAGFDVKRPSETSGNARGIKIKAARQLERLAAKKVALEKQY